MCDYKNGKIYKLGCNITKEAYIGSTVQSLEYRLATHKNCIDCCSKQIIERGNYYIELLETYPCETKYELRRKEGEYQRTMECININVAGRTHKEWYEDSKNNEKIINNRLEYRKTHREDKNKVQKVYRLENAEKIKKYKNAEITCECGVKSKRQNISRHKLSKKHIDRMEKLNS